MYVWACVTLSDTNIMGRHCGQYSVMNCRCNVSAFDLQRSMCRPSEIGVDLRRSMINNRGPGDVCIINAPSLVMFTLSLNQFT